MYINNVPEIEWNLGPYPPKPWKTVDPGGHENTLGGDTGEWCG